ncbi:glycoside hydrolase family 15 protein [Nonomuraea roseoviolacea subsp. roseoviolacea]|uniref:GH15 family glucan-1,4-alpha-glucosidase n=1 Tax=Nonomuraea roseoviolacea subsp. carminata TaxID=160689 RepID=A0ABT1KA30_9ACTN|nr:glycoside hydrolase family 15 protein [Nonomuraea roseoviolacea]MCP2350870.1 GH15 family glucan-1,4-alpha-glucosidase [Nonomuraea roseoviolacea subsp. carminata]
MRIEDYALIGDMQSAALVGRDGSIDWLCLPRFDSPACFAALLGGDRNGHWWIGPPGRQPATRRRYRPDTLILESEWDTPTGTVRVIDFMPPRDVNPDVVRIVEGVSGTVEVATQLRVRFDYGRIVPWVRRTDGHLQAVGGPDAAWLHSPVPLKGGDYAHRATFHVKAGQRLPFVFTWHPSHEPMPTQIHAEHQLDETEALWKEWVATCTHAGPWRDAVVRSLITLKALTYAPTGGIVAAPTTSLPEDLGGVRNWDYRYCWLRDATMALEALLNNGYLGEAAEWRSWLLRAIAGRSQDLQIMYGVAGERRLPEMQLDWLDGYEGSRPVRIGNDAVNQLQLDVYGEVMNALYLAGASGLTADERAWSIQRQLLDYVEEHWDEPDEGLWEVRGPRRHFTHSKVMCWVALDRAVKYVERYGRVGPVDKWRRTRDRIHAEVCEHAFDARRNTFTQSYGSTELDASLLLMPMVGFLPADDPRMVGTVAAIEKELMSDGFVLRYPVAEDNDVDGLPGGEGAFLACSFWLVEVMAMQGRREEAKELFERLLSLRNDLGLLSEEYDPRYSRLVGNFPQAFSHVPLIHAARALSEHDETPKLARDS